jgi:hypothetical protein
LLSKQRLVCSDQEEDATALALEQCRSDIMAVKIPTVRMVTWHCGNTKRLSINATL